MPWRGNGNRRLRATDDRAPRDAVAAADHDPGHHEH